MKSRKKTLILLLALVMILLMISGGIVATERYQYVVVYTHTQHCTDSFTATEPESSPWCWAIKMHTTEHTASLRVDDTTVGQTILNEVTDVDAGGSLTGLIHNGHSYIVYTGVGNDPTPGWATCSVASADYQQSGPQGP